MNTYGRLIAGFAIMLSSFPLVHAAEEENKHDFWVDARLRYEHVDQDNALRNADANTLRTRLGFESAEYNDFRFLVEAENIFAVGDNYNSTTNGLLTHSVVPDPEDTEINRVLLRYKGLPKTTVTLGRQRVVLDNARFIGNVGWRQNEQTFDALMISNSSLNKTTVTLGYIDKVRRIFGPDSPIGTMDMNSPIVNVSYTGVENTTIVAYGYFLDFQDAPANSQRTLGVRVTGKTKLSDLGVNYQLEFANQADYRSGAPTIDAHYIHANAAVSLDQWKFGVGHEILSGNGTYGFQTPLATGHAFNGWSDQFLATPADGLRDTYVDVGTQFQGVNLKAVYHVFDSDQGGESYGSEFNLVATRKINDQFSGGIKFATYSADDRGVDTQKLWVFVRFAY